MSETVSTFKYVGLGSELLIDHVYMQVIVKHTINYQIHIPNCRACYDEGKRVAETLMYSYSSQEGIDVRVARIFNTYGTRMNLADGRVISNFITQALSGDPITVSNQLMPAITARNMLLNAHRHVTLVNDFLIRIFLLGLWTGKSNKVITICL